MTMISEDIFTRDIEVRNVGPPAEQIFSDVPELPVVKVVGVRQMVRPVLRQVTELFSKKTHTPTIERLKTIN